MELAGESNAWPVGGLVTDSSLVSVVLLTGDQGHHGLDLRKLVRQDTQKSVSVHGDCRSVCHSLGGLAA